MFQHAYCSRIVPLTALHTKGGGTGGDSFKSSFSSASFEISAPSILFEKCLYKTKQNTSIVKKHPCTSIWRVIHWWFTLCTVCFYLLNTFFESKCSPINCSHLFFNFFHLKTIFVLKNKLHVVKKINCTMSISLLNLTHKIVHGRGLTLTSLIKGHARLFFSRKKSSLPSDFHVIDWKFHPTR